MKFPLRPISLGTVAVGLLVLAGCAQMPTGPSVAVMPGPNKPFDVFVADDKTCRDWAASSSGSTNQDASNQRFVGATATGVVLGAAAGALVGGSSRGAGVGAAIGGTMGAAAGSDQSSQTAYGAQRRYDIAYQQCMYAKGNQIPGSHYAARHAAPPPPPAQPYRTDPAPVPAAPTRPPEGVQPPPSR